MNQYTPNSFFLWVCRVLFDSLFSCRGDISPFWCDMAQQSQSQAVHIFIRLHLYTFLFFYFFFDCWTKGCVAPLPCFNVSAEHILWHLVACYLNFKKHGTWLCLRCCIRSGEWGKKHTDQTAAGAVLRHIRVTSLKIFKYRRCVRRGKFPGAPFVNFMSYLTL